MKRVALLFGAACLVAPSARAQGPTTSVVQNAAASVFRVHASACMIGGVPRKDRWGTGFAASVGGTVRFVTALHVVAGCGAQEVQYQGTARTVPLKHVDRTADLAELGVVADLGVPALPLGAAMPAPGSQVTTIGFPGTATPNSDTWPVRQVGSSTITALLQSAQTRQDLTTQGFPDLTATIINIQGVFPPGESGAPVIDTSGAVVGVANGNLKQGQMPYSWAFPASAVSRLVTSTDAPPSGSTLSDVLVADEEPAPVRSWGGLVASSLACGTLAFRYAGVQTMARLSATADVFSQSHIAMAQGYARQVNLEVAPTTEFDVYVDPASGANFAVPKNIHLAPSSVDCVGTDAARSVEMRVSVDDVVSINMTTPPVTAFSMRSVRFGEMVQPNPLYSTPVVQRSADQMWVQRFAEVYQFPGQAANEGYMTFAYRGNKLLMVGVRTLQPSPALTGNRSFYPAVIAVYAAGFVLR
jgi:S1-C subfamily serine protease